MNNEYLYDFQKKLFYIDSKIIHNFVFMIKDITHYAGEILRYIGLINDSLKSS